MKIIDGRFIPFTYSKGRRLGDANGVTTDSYVSGSIVALETDEGITGYGPGYGIGGPAAVTRLVDVVEGEDPRSATALWEKMNAHLFKIGNEGRDYMAATAIDAAMWDIKAKAAEEPLWRLLGATRPRIKAYASGIDLGLTDEEMIDFYRPFVRMGIDAAKLKVGVDLERDKVRLRCLRDLLSEINPRPHLMIDANEIWSAKQAVRHVAELEREFDLTWVEEPVRRWDYKGLKNVSRAIRSAVATGENLGDLHDFALLIDHSAVDVVQLGKNRSVTVSMRIASLAQAYQLPVSFNHSWGNMMGHVAAAMPNFTMKEVQDLEAPEGIACDSWYEDGYIVLGERPGWGITVDEATLTASTPTEVRGRRGTIGPHIRRKGAGYRVDLSEPTAGFYGEM